MKVLPLIISCCIYLVNGRLVEKNTEKNYETKPTVSHIPLRVSRQAFYDDGLGTSLEDYQRSYVRKERYSVNANKYSEEVLPVISRVTRDSAENRTETKKHAEVSKSKSTKVFIMKPIPKFNEADDEDFQGKVNGLTTKIIADSGEHEDEDFNLDDYEFDVNHDEFAGRGKPLEPRAKSKGNKDSMKILKSKPTTTPLPKIKIQSKVVIPARPSTNVKRNVNNNNKAADKMKEDYYDDIITTTKVADATAKRESDDDFSDESDSKEYNQKTPIRTIRSPWSLKILSDKMGSKGAKVMANVLAYFPLFPELQPPNRNEDKIIDVANLDPMTGREFAF